MGADAEPLTMMDLAGLVLVCIGFLAYSGFGFASNFMVAQVNVTLYFLYTSLLFEVSLYRAHLDKWHTLTSKITMK